MDVEPEDLSTNPPPVRTTMVPIITHKPTSSTPKMKPDLVDTCKWCQSRVSDMSSISLSKTGKDKRCHMLRPAYPVKK